jgi:MFS family permease
MLGSLPSELSKTLTHLPNSLRLHLLRHGTHSYPEAPRRLGKVVARSRRDLWFVFSFLSINLTQLISPGLLLLSVAAIVPTFFCSPFAGWLADRFGTEATVAPLLLLSVPWYLLLILKSSLAGFIAFLAISSGFLAMVVAPISSVFSFSPL